MHSVPDYRHDLYRSYVSGHQGEIAEGRTRPSVEVILSHLPSNRGVAILDVGCGQGQLLRMLASRGYVNASGIDASREQVELARRLGTERVEQADLYSHADRWAATYDVVTALDVVEHFDRSEVPRVFGAFAKLLRPGGTFILRTPNAAGPYGGRLLYSDLTHGVAYTARALEQAAAAAGFESIRSYPARPAGRGARQLVRRGLWRLIEGLMIAPLVVETGELRGHIVTQNLIGVATRRSITTS
jgi:2-polyprenyl-3-methyl-5-hydroxy-6-metoxy-1,4-benzoquinol methylase